MPRSAPATSCVVRWATARCHPGAAGELWMSVAQASVRKAGGSIDPKCERGHSLVVRLTSSVSSGVGPQRGSAASRRRPSAIRAGEPLPTSNSHGGPAPPGRRRARRAPAVDRGAVAAQQRVAVPVSAVAGRAREVPRRGARTGVLEVGPDRAVRRWRRGCGRRCRRATPARRAAPPAAGPPRARVHRRARVDVVGREHRLECVDHRGDLGERRQAGELTRVAGQRLVELAQVRCRRSRRRGRVASTDRARSGRT